MQENKRVYELIIHIPALCVKNIRILKNAQIMSTMHAWYLLEI